MTEERILRLAAKTPLERLEDLGKFMEIAQAELKETLRRLIEDQFEAERSRLQWGPSDETKGLVARQQKIRFSDANMAEWLEIDEKEWQLLKVNKISFKNYAKANELLTENRYASEH